MSEARLNEMISDLKERIGFVSKHQKVQHLLNIMADRIKSKAQSDKNPYLMPQANVTLFNRTGAKTSFQRQRAKTPSLVRKPLSSEAQTRPETRERQNLRHLVSQLNSNAKITVKPASVPTSEFIKSLFADDEWSEVANKRQQN